MTMHNRATLKKPTRWIMPVFIALTLLVGCSDNSVEDNSKQAQVHQKTADSYIKQGQYRAAIIEARNVMKFAPSSPAGAITLATIYNTIGAPASTITLLEPMANKTPAAMLALAEAYTLSGKTISAQQLLDTYKSTNSNSDNNDSKSAENNEHFALLQARVFAATKQFDQARNTLTQLLAANPNHIDAQLRLIRVELADGNMAGAKTSLTQLLATNSKNPELLHLRAQTAYLENNLDDAERYLTDALSYLPQTDIITPLKTRVLQQLSDTLTQQGRSTEALIYARLLAEANPEGHQANKTLNKAMALYQSGDLDEAEQLLLKLYEEYPNNNTSGMLLGMINYQQGDMTAASSLLEQNIDPETASSAVVSSTAIAQLRLGQADKAIELLGNALKAQPNDAGINSIYGLALLNTNPKDPQGAAALQKALALDPTKSQLRNVLARHFIATEQLPKAYEQLTTALQQNPSDAEALRVYADALLANDNAQQAQKITNSFVQSNPDNANGYIQQAKISVLAKDIMGAQRALEKAVTIDNSNTQALLALGQIHLSNQQWPQASQRFETVINLDKNSVIAYKGLISSYEARQQGDTITNSLKQSVATDSGNVVLAAVLAEYHARKGNAELAEQYIDQALAGSLENAYVNATAVNIYRGLSNQLAASNQTEQAKAALNKALKIDGNNTMLLSDMVAIEIASTNYQQASQLAKQIAALAPDSSLADYLQGRILAAQQQWPQAITRLQTAWQRQPNNSIATTLYSALNANNNSDQAAAFIDEWQNLLPQSATPLIIKATQLQQQSKAAAASELYENAIALSPNNVVALNNLAWLYFENGNPKARELGKKAYELAPGNAGVADTYGWILVNEGEVNEGIKLLEQALAAGRASGADTTEIEAHLNIAENKQ